jgi:membrane dipeptidase
MISRRKFLTSTVLSSLGVTLLSEQLIGGSWLQTDYLSFDLHCHPGAFLSKGTKAYPGDAAVLKTVTEMNAGRLSGGFFGLVADAPLIELGPAGVITKGTFGPGDGWREYQRQMAILKEMLKTLPATLATKAADLDRGFTDKKVAAFISCEGGDFLGGDPSLLDQAYADGVRSVQIVHYVPNELGDLQTSAPVHNGLSAAGKAVVKKMNSLGMVIDVAHASYKTVQDVVELTTAPIILSHSILKMENTRPLSARAITPEHAKLVAKTGGVIGAWPSGFNTSFDEYVDNTLLLVKTVGVDHVGLGTDMDGNFKPVLSSYTQLPQWAAAMEAKGLSREEVGKVMGGNVRRVLGKVIG